MAPPPGARIQVKHVRFSGSRDFCAETRRGTEKEPSMAAFAALWGEEACTFCPRGTTSTSPPRKPGPSWRSGAFWIATPTAARRFEERVGLRPARRGAPPPPASGAVEAPAAPHAHSRPLPVRATLPHASAPVHPVQVRCARPSTSPRWWLPPRRRVCEASHRVAAIACM